MVNLIKILQAKPLSIEDIAIKAKLSKSEVRRNLSNLKLSGYLVEKIGDKWQIGRTPHAVSKSVSKDLSITSEEDNTFKFGFLGDTHLGSKYERLDVLNDLYDIFELEGVQTVFHQGNWVDGECRLNRHDLTVHGVDAQLRYLAANYPKKKGIVTYAITGDDHEGWWAHNEGIDVGARLENIMHSEGREDWVCTGYMEAYIKLINANTKKTNNLLSMHPGGGSAYAVSYRPQKIVESFSGGEKPAVLLIGHYHKLSYNMIRGVHAIQTGCTQDQTPFMRKKGLDAHVGGGICTLSQDPKTGAIYRCIFDSFNYYNRGFTSNRWSYDGKSVNLPKRSAN